ncbi:hypothetical protein V8C86DRAFT_1367049 [Haematococcus lacustris]
MQTRSSELEALEKLQAVAQHLKQRWTLHPAKSGELQRRQVSLVVYCEHEQCAAPPPSLQLPPSTPVCAKRKPASACILKEEAAQPSTPTLTRSNVLFDPSARSAAGDNSDPSSALALPYSMVAMQPCSTSLVWHDNAAVWAQDLALRAAPPDAQPGTPGRRNSAMAQSPFKSIKSAQAAAAARAASNIAAAACRHVVQAAVQLSIVQGHHTHLHHSQYRPWLLLYLTACG